MNFAASHGGSLSRLGYQVQPLPDPDAPLTLVAGTGKVQLVPWEIITPHKKLGPAFRQWCIGSFGWTVERKAKDATTLFYRAYRPVKCQATRIDMKDHWGRVHTFRVAGEGEYTVAYSGREKFMPHYIELANTEAKDLTPIARGAADVAADYFVVMALRYGMRRILTPRSK